MKTAAEAFADEFAACAALGMDDAACRRHAEHARKLHQDIVAETVAKADRRGKHGHRNAYNTVVGAMPSNADELRLAVERAAAGQERHGRWFALVALANVPSGGYPGLRKGVFGPKLASRILGREGQVDWIPSTMRRQDRDGFAAAAKFGATLVAVWGGQEARAA